MTFIPFCLYLQSLKPLVGSKVSEAYTLDRMLAAASSMSISQIELFKNGIPQVNE